MVMSATKMTYLPQDEFVEERALQMSVDKQGSQIIGAMTLKFLQRSCVIMFQWRIYFFHMDALPIFSLNIVSGELSIAAPEVNPNVV